MPIVHVPQRRRPDRWATLKRFFRLQGRLGRLQYRANFEIHELSAPEPASEGEELGRRDEEGGRA